MIVRYKPGEFETAIGHIKDCYQKFELRATFDYDVLDKDFEEGQLNTEWLIQRLLFCFTTIAIIIACMGVFGLTLFNAQRRTKEIGIRKVFGATVPQIMVMLSQAFLKPILISCVIAFPTANYIMERFLEGYAFRINITMTSFLLVGSIMIIIVLLIVSNQSYQAAVRNPVDSLKTE